MSKNKLKKDYSYYHIANKILTRIEKCEREPKLSTLLKIIEGLELSLSDFFKGFV